MCRMPLVSARREIVAWLIGSLRAVPGRVRVLADAGEGWGTSLLRKAQRDQLLSACTPATAALSAQGRTVSAASFCCSSVPSARSEQASSVRAAEAMTR